MQPIDLMKLTDVLNQMRDEKSTLDNYALPGLSSTLLPGGLGDYEKQVISQASCFTPVSTTYRAGDVYSMLNDDIHSIQFSRGAQVLFIEGPERSTTSIVLEPSTVDLLSHVPTFETRPWMFKRRN